MSISIGDKIFLSITLANFGLILVNICFFIHLAHTKTGYMLTYLKHCSAVAKGADMVNSGISGRLRLLNMITALMVIPRRFLRVGSADAEDLENFPPTLRLKILLIYYGGALSFVVMITTLALRKLEYL